MNRERSCTCIISFIKLRPKARQSRGADPYFSNLEMWFLMKLDDLRELRACLPYGRTLFRYEADWYQIMLMEYLLQSGWTAPAIRRSNFARLLEGNRIRNIIAGKGKLHLDANDLTYLHQVGGIPWRLTLDKWDAEGDWRYCQVTRRGFNLVLQVNFPKLHNRIYQHLISKTGRDYFNYPGHPVANGEKTMAWARLDVDRENGEVLIEEVQSDWVRSAKRFEKHPRNLHSRLESENRQLRKQLRRTSTKILGDIRHYVDLVLPAYTQSWQETVLASVLFFSIRELGVTNVFMHDFDTGNRLKNISPSWGLPPRSIYTSLPKKFCFRKTDRTPILAVQSVQRLKKAKKRVHRIRNSTFWHLELDRQQTIDTTSDHIH